MVDRRANTKRCNDFVESNCERVSCRHVGGGDTGRELRCALAGPIAKWPHASLAPSDGFIHQSFSSEGGDSDARAGSEFWVPKLIVLMFDELTLPATNVLFYRIGPLLSPAPGGLARRLLRLISESTVGRHSSFDRDLIGVRAGLPRTNFAGLFCPPAIRIACLSQS